MAYLKVLNVGQGDCMTIRPPESCEFKNELLYVDLGNGLSDISREALVYDNIRVILTHSHRDHILGIVHLLPYMRQVREVVLPYCVNEIWLIAKAVMNLKGMRSAYGCDDLLHELQDMDFMQRLLKCVLGSDNIKVTFAHEGSKLCDHIRFLNPPLHDVKPELLYGDLKMREDEFYDLFEEKFAEELSYYVRAVREQRENYLSDNGFNRYFIKGDRENENAAQMRRAGCEIVLEFINKNRKKLSAFNNDPGRSNLKPVMENYKMKVHDACLVMTLENNGTTYLLSGDASKNVFYRLHKNGNLPHADIFKVPHHGSKNNLDEKILGYVDPRIAVISHGNGKFGRARDTHPNKEVIDLLESKHIEIFVTNDVIKGGVTVFEKKKYATYNLEIE